MIVARSSGPGAGALSPTPAGAFEPSGSGVQPYGDWRGRTYSVSVTASF